MGWQHVRYHNLRRGPVQDRQSSVYARSTFHVLVFLRVETGRDPIEALRALREGLEAGGAAELVYAGRVAVVGIESRQLPETAWDAVVLVQYPSREAYRAAAGSPAYRAALSPFAETFAQGFERPVLLNLALPQLLLALRAYQVVTRQPSHYPLLPAEPGEIDPRAPNRPDRLAGLGAVEDLGRDAVVIVNLLRRGTPEQRDADRRYGFEMAGLFAEGAHGPMHMGSAVTLEGDAEFDMVALVYYPGVDYLRELMASRFFNGIVGGKQPGDTLAVVTVPVLSSL
jgi:uncharacterized protein (DUF1330 family)